MDNPDWILYVKTRCPWCVEATAYLRENGYEFEEVDVLHDAAAYKEMQKISGQRYTPTLVIGDLVLADFDVDQLEDFLAENALQPPKV